MICAFEGWNDVGNAATKVIKHLDERWDGEPIAAMNPDDYYDFMVYRPHIKSQDGTRYVEWPTTRFSVCTLSDASFDIVLVHGLEPNMRWRDFCDEILEIADMLEVELIIQ